MNPIKGILRPIDPDNGIAHFYADAGWNCPVILCKDPDNGINQIEEFKDIPAKGIPVEYVNGVGIITTTKF